MSGSTRICDAATPRSADTVSADAADYAQNNWGMFAAMHLVASGRRAHPERSTSELELH